MEKACPGFDPASAHANFGMMSNVPKPPKRKIDNRSLMMEKWGEMVQRQDECTGLQALFRGCETGDHDGHVPRSLSATLCTIRIASTHCGS